MKKSIIYIFICLFAVLLMSHNVHAFSITQNVDVIQSVNRPPVSFFNGTSWTSYQTGTIDFNNSSGNFSQLQMRISDFSSVQQFEKGDYLVLTGFFSANRLVRGDNIETVGGFIGSNSENISCSVIDLEFGAVQTYVQNTESWYRADFQLTCRFIVNSRFPTVNFRVRPDAFGVSGTKLNISFNTAYLVTRSSDTQKEEEATQDAADNSATTGNTSKNNAQNATSSLLSVITSGIGAITSASPTNCKINGNMGNLDVGNIDLCANPVPTFMALIGSIIAVLVVLPLVILLFNRFISIIRSFQR